MTSKVRDSTVFIFYIYQSSFHFQFLPNMAGFPVIFNYFRHSGVFGTDKTPNSRAQRHCDKCYTSYKRIYYDIKPVRKEEGKSYWKIPLCDNDATREK